MISSDDLARCRAESSAVPDSDDEDAPTRQKSSLPIRLRIPCDKAHEKVAASLKEAIKLYEDFDSFYTTIGTNDYNIVKDDIDSALQDIYKERVKCVDTLEALGKSRMKDEIEKIEVFFDRIMEFGYAIKIASGCNVIATSSKEDLKKLKEGGAIEEDEGENESGQKGKNKRDGGGKDDGIPAYLKTRRLTGMEDCKECNKFNKLVMYVQQCLRGGDLRRYDEYVYERVKTKEGKNTAAWRQKCTIKQFIYRCCGKAINPKMWMIVAAASDIVAGVVRYFIDSEDPEFPVLNRIKTLFSFDNGIFDAEKSIFYKLGSDEYNEKFMNSEDVPSKHLYKKFEVDEWERVFGVFSSDNATKEEIRDAWRSIETEAVNGLFYYQLENEDQSVIDMMYVTVGRLLHELGKRDKLGYVGMIVGKAGTGKSTFCNYLTTLWEKSDAGVLSNNCERQFALWSFADKYVFIAPEVKADFKLDQAEWQGITTGDIMSIAGKFVKAEMKNWAVPGFFAGNQVPAWTDHSGSVLRRLLFWNFNKKIESENPDLDDELVEQTPSFIMKCSFAYNWFLRFCGGGGALWKNVPQYFMDRRKELAAQLNPLESFIITKLEADEDSAIPLDDFKKEVKAFCTDNGFGFMKFAGSTYTDVLEDHGFKIGVFTYRNTNPPQRMESVIGCRLKQEAFLDVDDES